MGRQRTVLMEWMSQVRWGLFDLDNTLYPSDSGVFQAIGPRIHDFMAERLGMDDDLIASLRQE